VIHVNLRQYLVALEVEAVLLILARCEAETWEWLSSVVVEEEINNTPSEERRARVRNMLSGAHRTVALVDSTIVCAQELHAMGLRTCDTLHLACAEQATVDVFLTDDRVLRIATRYIADLKVRVANPLNWLLEVI